MALTTLASVKTHLGVTGTGEDAALAQWIGGASAAIRRHVGDYLYGAIGGISQANPAIVTCPGHALETGMTVTIAGADGTPPINGARQVTVIDPDTFSVPVNVAIAGTRGVFCRTYTEFYNGTGSDALLLTHTPVQAIASVYLDAGGCFGDAVGSFANSTLLVEGADFALWRDNASESDASHRGVLLRITGSPWPRPAARTMGLLTLSPGDPLGNVKVTYSAGYLRLLPEVTLAANQLVAQLRKGAADGGPLKSERYDYYSYERLDGEAGLLGSAAHLLRRLKRWTL